MKKYLFLAAVAALMMTSCSSDEVVKESEIKNGAIEFRTLTDKNQSRAAVTDGSNILGFTLTGWWVEGKQYLFNSFDITRNAGIDDKGNLETEEWSYSPPRYWPSKGDVNFFAYSPASSVNVSKNKDLRQTAPLTVNPTIEYTVSNVQNLQEDFLVALKFLQNKNSGKVSLNFQHALSRVKFNAKKTKNLEYTIYGIKLMNLYSKAELTYDKSNDGSLSVGIPTTQFNYGNASNNPIILWKSHSEKVDYKVDLSDAPIYVQFDNKSVIGATNALLVMPQVTELGEVQDSNDLEYVNKTAIDGAFYVEIEYKSFLKEGNNIIYYAGTASKTAKYYIPVKDQIRVNQKTPFPFEIGREYVFNLTFGDEGATARPIQFNVTVSNWTDEEHVQL